MGTSDLHYEMVSNSFSISSLDGKLSVTSSLDRELKSSHTFDVLAIDGGGHTGKVAVTVNVIDVNDNAPLFDKLFYNVSVHVNFPIGGVVGYVKASDADEGRNAEVVYSSPTAEGKSYCQT